LSYAIEMELIFTYFSDVACKVISVFIFDYLLKKIEKLDQILYLVHRIIHEICTAFVHFT